MNLREWQERGWEYFKLHNNCIFEVATGSGKTYMTIYIIKRLIEVNPHLKILIVGPKNVILEHTWMDELYNNGFPINKVGLYNMNAKEFSQITLVSMMSIHRLIETGIYDVFDMVIFDEVHNYGTPNFAKRLMIPKKYKIGLTATLKREDMRHIYLKQYFSNNIFTYDISEALKDEILNPFEFHHINIPMDEHTKLLYETLSDKIRALYSIIGTSFKNLNINNPEHNSLLKLLNERRELINNYPLKKDIVKKIILNNNESKILVFNQYNKVSTMLYWELQESEINCDIINSTIPDKIRFKVLKDFENDKIDVLLATTMLDEGYNLPKIDIAILMAQNSTDKQFIQRMGRVLRKKDKNSKVYYLTVEDTYEEENFTNKKDFIKSIALSYNEISL